VPDPLDGPGPYIVITGIAQFNGTPLSPAGSRFAEKIPSLNDNFTKIMGRHTIKTGFAWQQNNDNQLSAVYNQYTFSNVANYVAAKNGTNPFAYSTYSTTLGTPGAAYKSNFYDGFVQDSWQLRPNLLVIYGLRYDYYAAPPGEANAPFVYTRNFHNPTKDFAPRLGFAYSLNSKTVIRASSGIFFDVPSTNLWYNSLINDGSPKAFQDSLTPTSAGAPAFPNLVNPVGAVQVTPSITTLSPNYRTPYTINSTLQITRQLGQNDALTVGYVDTQARELTYETDMNLINPVSYLADGRPVYSAAVNANTRLFPQFNAIKLQTSGANANYNALVTSYSRRFSAGYSVNASYTWSHSLSDAPELYGYDQAVQVIEDPTNRRRDYGNSVINRPNAFSTSAVMQPTFHLDNKFANRLANGNLLTVLINMSSGDQQNLTTSTNLNNSADGAQQRPLYVGRDTLRTPAVYQVDARYTRTIYSYKERLHVKLLAEANNVFNTRNITAISASAVTNSLGVITTAPTLVPTSSTVEGRLMQFGIRTDW
jgi:hypothetical protein